METIHVLLIMVLMMEDRFECQIYSDKQGESARKHLDLSTILYGELLIIMVQFADKVYSP